MFVESFSICPVLAVLGKGEAVFKFVIILPGCEGRELTGRAHCVDTESNDSISFLDYFSSSNSRRPHNDNTDQLEPPNI